MVNAIPIPLMGSTLSIWLSERGFEKSTIGLFALLHLPFNFKILWSLLIDRQPRKRWTFLSLMGISLCILAISFFDSTEMLVVLLLTLSLMTGCLYIVGIAYELESIEEKQYSMGSAWVTAGYRIGLLCSGACALYISHVWGWSSVFICLAGVVAFAAFYVLWLPEPFKSKRRYNGFIIEPFLSFFQNSQWPTILLLLLLFKTGNQFLRSMEGPFYLSLGYDKVELSVAAKLWGVVATISGSFVAGLWFRGKDPMVSLGKAAFLHGFSLSGYVILSIIGKSLLGLYMIVAVENFTGGIALTAFIYFLWKVCNPLYAAVQYALLWSVFSIKADILACLGGLLATYLSWTAFFLVLFSLGIAASVCISFVVSRLNNTEQFQQN